MNNWKNIWEKRTIDRSVIQNEDVFLKFCELKRADGFDTNIEGEYYESFWNEWFGMYNELLANSHGKKINSVFEVGCGSGVNLYMFQQKVKGIKVAGIDYSSALVDIAKEVLKTDKVYCDEAIKMDVKTKYDVVISDSVFQYFPDEKYGINVLQRMYEKANNALVISEIHDLDKKEECMQYRKQMYEGYEKKYEGLDKTFYSKTLFLNFADRYHCDIKFSPNRNPFYWNSNFIYNCYIYKVGSETENNKG